MTKRDNSLAQLYKQRGFSLEGMGGNCSAYGKGNGQIIVSAAKSEGDHPRTKAEPVVVTVYDKDNQAIMCLHFASSTKFFGFYDAGASWYGGVR